MTKRVYGVGINDSPHPVSNTIDGKRVWCLSYTRWKAMLARCYCPKVSAWRPTYEGCTVDPRWHSYTAFRDWLIGQPDWTELQLDKDLLVPGNKVYSPETCVLISGVTNSFTIDSGAIRGGWPLGVFFHKRVGRFIGQCSNPFTKRLEHLGCFSTPVEAHQAWKQRKLELAIQLAALQKDPRVAAALIERYT